MIVDERRFSINHRHGSGTRSTRRVGGRWLLVGGRGGGEGDGGGVLMDNARASRSATRVTRAGTLIIRDVSPYFVSLLPPPLTPITRPATRFVMLITTQSPRDNSH